VVWDFLLGVLPLEKGCSLSLGYLLGLVLLPESFYLSKVMVLGVALCLWLGDNIVILSMVKQAQYSNIALLLVPLVPQQKKILC
jgi:hypothetical protein